MLEPTFLQSCGFSDQAILDTDKLFISGHSLGGMTSIVCCEGDQNIFKLCLS